ncbi:MAG TPA: TRAP transporter small permease [Usitatibacter sp.]|nr:TRAP transporter small permease [Usitatibacter sp.]
MRRRAAAWADRLCAFIGITVGIAAFAIALLVGYSVVARELFHASEFGITDVSTYLMAYITFVGAAYGIWAGAHVGVHIITHRLRGRPRTAVSFVANALLTAVAGVFAWVSAGFWVDAWSSGERAWGTFSVPMWIPYSSMLAGTMLFLLLQLARMLLGRADFEPAHREAE